MIDTKLLRQKILDLAIRGKLVPQDPADEPASELLKKIKAEKDALVKAGKIKKDKHESHIFKGDDNRYYETIDGTTTDITEEIPFDLPDSWAWCRVENIGIINPRNKINDDTVVSFMPMTQLAAGYGSQYDLSERTWLSVKSGFTHFAENDVVFAKITPCFQNRKSAVMRGLKNGYGAGTTELHVIRCLSGVIPEYILLFVKNQSFISDAVATIQGVVGQQRIDANFVKKYFLPLPPLAEQQRIVEQIETLLKYVDIIDTDAETLEKSITLAKQKILDLAIRGKLVPQDPADEPASELLKKIKAEKDALIKAGKIKKDKHESYIFKSDDNCYHENIDGKVTNITDEIPFDLPDSWTWSRIENIGVLNPRNKIEDDTEVSFMPMAQLEAGFGSKYTLSEKNWKEVKSGFTHFAENDIVFAKITPCFQNRKSAVMRGLKNGYGAGTTELHVLRSNSYLIVPEYALLFVKTQSFITDAVATIQGVVGQQRIDAGFVKHYLFPIPPLAEQKRIVSQVEKLLSALETMRG